MLVLIFIIYTTNILCCFFGLLLIFAYPSCSVCSYSGIAIQILYLTSKLSTCLFYLQRAKLAQAFQRKIPIYCFNKVFPAIACSLYFVFLSLFLFEDKAEDYGHCSDVDISVPFIKKQTYHIKKWCVLDTSTSQFYISSNIAIEVILTVFFIYLFCAPLIALLKPTPICSNRSYRTQLSHKNECNMNYLANINSKSYLLNSANIQNGDNVMKMDVLRTHSNEKLDLQSLDTQQSEIKQILTYNIVLSLIGFIFSTLTIIVWPIEDATKERNRYRMNLWTDYMVNSVTSFLMLARNRKFLHHYLCCPKWRKNCRDRRMKRKAKRFKILSTRNEQGIFHCDDHFSSTTNYYHNMVVSNAEPTLTYPSSLNMIENDD